MENRVFESIATIAAGVIGVAILAILVSKNAQTSNVLGAAGSAFSNVLSAAEAPVTGATAAPVNTQSSNILGGLSLPSLNTGVAFPGL